MREREPGAVPDQGAGGAPRRGHPAWWDVLGLVCLVAIAYGQTLRFDFVWDDNAFVLESPVWRGRLTWQEVLTSPTSALLPEMQDAKRVYRPLLAITLAAERPVWGTHPGGFHLVSILAHVSTVLLLWHLTRRLTGNPWAAFAGAALLAVHPSAVEAAAFLGARMDLFVGLGMAAVLLLVRGSLGPGGGWRLAGALACFALALGSKETAVAIPLIVAWAAWAYPAWFAGPHEPPTRSGLAARVAPFWVLLGLYALLRRAVIGSLVPTAMGWADVPPQTLRALVAMATWAEMTLIPRPVTAYIRVNPPTGLADGRVLLGLVVIGALLAGLWSLRRRFPALALALGWYAAALVPVSNVLPVYAEHQVYVAERSLYPALVGWCLFLGAGLHLLLGHAKAGPARSRTLIGVTGGVVLATFLVVTIAKVGAWRDDVTLWRTALASDSGNVLIHLNLSWALARAADREGAQGVLREAAAMFPRDPRVPHLAGWLAELRGQPEEALRQYERAIALDLREEKVYRSAFVMAVQSQAWDRAARWVVRAADLFPRAAWPQVGLGWYDAREGRSDLARAHFDRAARLEPDSPERPWFLCQLLVAEGRVAEAAAACRDATALDPSHLPARRVLALIAEREGRLPEAIDQWRRIADALLTGSQRQEVVARLQRLEAASGARMPGRQE